MRAKKIKNRKMWALLLLAGCVAFSGRPVFQIAEAQQTEEAATVQKEGTSAQQEVIDTDDSLSFLDVLPDPEDGAAVQEGLVLEEIPSLQEGPILDDRPLRQDDLTAGEDPSKAENLLDSGEEGTDLVPYVGDDLPSLSNYLQEPISRPTYHTAAGWSQEREEIPDGLYQTEEGVRLYRDGRYCIDGSHLGEEGLYYADEEGYLVRGWLKTLLGTSQEEVTTVADNQFAYRYYDPVTCTQVQGYQVVDGLPHYFSAEGGHLLKNAGITLEDGYYYADNYGICSRVYLSFGQEITGSYDWDNQALLARNQVMAVDPDTYQGQDGAYSFRPKWYPGVTTMEFVGFTPMTTQSGYYGTLLDDSSKGRIGVIYRRVGRYRGRQVDLRLMITDYTFYSLYGQEEVGYFFVGAERIGLFASNTRDITANLEFLDHETQETMVVQGYATFSDIDIGQSVTFLGGADEVYVSNDCVLYKDPSSLTFTAPFLLPRVGSDVTDANRENWVQVNYTSDHLTYRFGCAYTQYRFVFGDLPINGESHLVWKRDYTGYAPDYYMINPNTGNLWESWQGLYDQRLGRVSIPPLIKQVSDRDETLVDQNHLTEEGETFVYTLSHAVPGESEAYFYTSYEITDLLPEDLVLDLSTFRITDDGERNLTDWFEISYEGRTLSIRGKPSVLATEAFYDRNYRVQIPVRIREETDLSSYVQEAYRIENRAEVSFTRLGTTEEAESNPVYTEYQLPPLRTGEIILTKEILGEEVLWAHGEPTYLFCVTGTDERGESHTYQTALTFQKAVAQGNEGWLTESAVLPRVPFGTYEIYELEVLGSELVDAKVLQGNLTIRQNQEAIPVPGCLPSFYGEGSLTEEAPVMEISFTDRLSRADGYRHRDVVTNVLPVILS